MADKVARGSCVEKLVSENLDWIGLEQENGRVKVLDYGAGTKLFSQVGFFVFNVKVMHPHSSDTIIGVSSLSHPSPRNRQLARHGPAVQQDCCSQQR